GFSPLSLHDALPISGGLGYLLLPIASLPQVDMPTINVQANLPGASAEVMVTSVATPLERQFGHIAGLTEMTSSSSQGMTRINLQDRKSTRLNSSHVK